MDNILENLKHMASLSLDHNIDINQHIISCKYALEIIEFKDNQLKLLKESCNILLNKINLLEQNIIGLETSNQIRANMIQTCFEIINNLNKLKELNK